MANTKKKLANRFKALLSSKIKISEKIPLAYYCTSQLAFQTRIESGREKNDESRKKRTLEGGAHFFNTSRGMKEKLHVLTCEKQKRCARFTIHHPIFVRAREGGR